MRGMERAYERDGAQLIEANGLSYEWRGVEPLTIGDRIRVPETWVSRLRNGPGPWTATVTALGTTYDGQLASVIARAT